MKDWAIIRREYIEKVRTKGFVLSTLLIPMLMSLMFIIPMPISTTGMLGLTCQYLYLAFILTDQMQTITHIIPQQ